ncbi:ribonuclease D [Trichlorobacter ammonificans]|uniref:Ribonuclease D n=1 Tax=Trichlorobacter ammonificans TaxID=2916410 RepID=A0ABN8HNG9_9BACT|nr:HRDC domain-containing protein [Trichlorobacter ammonificans]CAH2032707.1 Ribonuclease D [Trichlorobacter ammonificans]
MAYTLIESTSLLAQVCDSLRGAPELALDLEADSLHHYREKVCLLQLSSREATWLIDPLQVDDLAPLAALLADPAVLTVFHGGDYDIRSLHRDFGITVARMFDTMIAAQFLGKPEFGLAALLRNHFGVELDKKYQKADWSKRPLTPEMAAYAANDTAHLLRLADLLRGRLDECGRTAWVAEECALVAANRMAEKGEGPLFLQFKGAGKLKPRNLAVLEELLQLRDGLARELDRPPFKVLPSEALLQLAERQPDTLPEMDGIAGLTPKLKSRHGERLLAAVQHAKALPDNELPRYPRTRGEANPGVKARLTGLKQWREHFSGSIGLSPGLIAPNWLLERIAEQQPDNPAQLAALPGVRRWQTDLWGSEVMTLLAKEKQAP